MLSRPAPLSSDSILQNCFDSYSRQGTSLCWQVFGNVLIDGCATCSKGFLSGHKRAKVQFTFWLALSRLFEKQKRLLLLRKRKSQNNQLAAFVFQLLLVWNFSNVYLKYWCRLVNKKCLGNLHTLYICSDRFCMHGCVVQKTENRPASCLYTLQMHRVCKTWHAKSSMCARRCGTKFPKVRIVFMCATR